MIARKTRLIPRSHCITKSMSDRINEMRAAPHRRDGYFDKLPEDRRRLATLEREAAGCE